jgi:hypothetical protein
MESVETSMQPQAPSPTTIAHDFDNKDNDFDLDPQDFDLNNGGNDDYDPYAEDEDTPLAELIAMKQLNINAEIEDPVTEIEADPKALR